MIQYVEWTEPRERPLNGNSGGCSSSTASAPSAASSSKCSSVVAVVVAKVAILALWWRCGVPTQGTALLNMAFVGLRDSPCVYVYRSSEN